MVSHSDVKGLERAKGSSVGQLLLKAARLLDEVALARVNRRAAPGTPVLRPAHTRLLPHIAFDGTRVGTVAERVGVTKQAVSQLITELEELGVVELAPDPADGRARLVRFTPRGLLAIQQGLGTLREVEESLAAEVGTPPIRALEGALAILTPVLERMAGQERLEPEPAADPRQKRNEKRNEKRQGVRVRLVTSR